MERIGFWSIVKSSSLFLAAGAAGSAAFGFYDGLWVPLLRDGQTAAEAAKAAQGLLPEALVDWAAQRVACGEAWPKAIDSTPPGGGGGWRAVASAA